MKRQWRCLVCNTSGEVEIVEPITTQNHFENCKAVMVDHRLKAGLAADFSVRAELDYHQIQTKVSHE